MESWFLDGEKSNSAKMVLINFLAHSLQKGQKFGENPLFSPNPINMWLLGYFGMQKFISALKTELNPTVFEKNAKNKIK